MHILYRKSIDRLPWTAEARNLHTAAVEAAPAWDNPAAQTRVADRTCVAARGEGDGRRGSGC
jgi:hypothetical protein